MASHRPVSKQRTSGCGKVAGDRLVQGARRGAISKLASLTPAEVARGLATASGGNHGAAVAYAGWVAGHPATVFVPDNVSPLKAQKIQGWGARLEVAGAVWDESNRVALARVAQDGLTYVHPFADPAVIAGQGTVALEILEQDPAIDTLLVAIGGGGLIAGMAIAAKALKPEIRIIGVEPTGAPTLHASVQAGRGVELPEITTTVPTMAARKTEPVNLAIVQRHVIWRRAMAMRAWSVIRAALKPDIPRRRYHARDGAVEAARQWLVREALSPGAGPPSRAGPARRGCARGSGRNRS